MPSKKESKCIIRGCSDSRHSRGLCVNHYAIARRAVNQGKASWEQLVKEGLAAQKKSRGQKPGSFAKQIEAIGQGSEESATTK